jgi:hypothetical protein
MNPGCSRCKFYREGGLYDAPGCRHPSNLKPRLDEHSDYTLVVQTLGQKNGDRQCEFYFRRFNRIKSFFEKILKM